MQRENSPIMSNFSWHRHNGLSLLPSEVAFWMHKFPSQYYLFSLRPCPSSWHCWKWPVVHPEVKWSCFCASGVSYSSWWWRLGQSSLVACCCCWCRRACGYSCVTRSRDFGWFQVAPTTKIHRWGSSVVRLLHPSAMKLVIPCLDLVSSGWRRYWGSDSTKRALHSSKYSPHPYKSYCCLCWLR